LWNSRSYFRKVLEIPIAIYIDALWPKKRILEVYLNIAEFGEGIFGIEAAAQTYFGRSASRLGPRASALLTATLPNPLGRNPAKPSRQHSHIANIVQKRAAKSGGYTQCVR
ncbi:MAG: transglycosylase domain-containing protein, partial [Rhizobiaceae bacterium]